MSFGMIMQNRYIDTDSFIVYIKTSNVQKDIAEEETRFKTSNYELHRPLPTGKDKKLN